MKTLVEDPAEEKIQTPRQLRKKVKKPAAAAVPGAATDKDKNTKDAASKGKPAAAAASGAQKP